MTTKKQTMLIAHRFLFALVISLGVILNHGSVRAETDDEYWADLKPDFFGEKILLPSNGEVTISAPDIAYDGARIPITVQIKPDLLVGAKQLHLIIDRNPAPLAARIEIGNGLHSGINIGAHTFTIRVRSEYKSLVRVVLEMKDGRHLMAATKVDFLNTVGGCSMPTPKDLENDIAKHGNMRMMVRADAAEHRHWRQGTVRVRHPNITGMQMDPKTGTFLPAWFVEYLEIKQDQELIYRIHAGVSLSRNPHFRFTYASTSNHHDLQALARDTKGSAFKKTLNYPENKGF